MSSSIPSWQILTAHAQPFRGARDLAFCLKVPLDSLRVWASSEGSGETARMRRLAWTFAARIGDKYQIHLTRSILLVTKRRGVEICVQMYTFNVILLVAQIYEKCKWKFRKNVRECTSTIKQCRPERSSLIRVYTVCHSICILCTHYTMVKPHSSHFRIITAIFLDVWIFQIFTVNLLTVEPVMRYLRSLQPCKTQTGLLSYRTS